MLWWFELWLVTYADFYAADVCQTVHGALADLPAFEFIAGAEHLHHILPLARTAASHSRLTNLQSNTYDPELDIKIRHANFLAKFLIENRLEPHPSKS
jgi:hypothetical protein